MSVDFSKMDRRIKIEALVITSDGLGGNTETWILFVEVWCEPVPVYGREIYKYRGINEKIDYEMRIRFREDITSSMRVKYTIKGVEKIMHINSIIDTSEKQERLELLCIWE